ncbi:MAG TPA: quinol:cytochrome C oxidoreductase [Crocinitomicaceae bacterium]|nr:quinol:cytochrome C oxidoreductase [Crocinitomicaceae bacterium]
MEFKISKKANMLTMVLMIVGVVFTGIGVAIELSSAENHLAQRFLANLLVDGFFFFGIGLGALFFLALVYATETAWYVAIKRIVESVAMYIPYGAGILLVALLIITFLDGAHIYLWMDSSHTDINSPHYDFLIDKKSAYMNKIFFWIRTLMYIGIYILFLRGFRNRSLQEDEIGGTDIHFKNYRKGATFLVFFAVFSTTSAWDWIMSIDIHWFSTLFGWYVFSGIWVSAMVTLVVLTLYLRHKGYLPHVNDSHIHDITTWMFAISFLWSYLWFSQYMLIWYSNIPEEVTYYMTRIEHYKISFFGMFFINFVFPMLILMSRDAKRTPYVIIFVGLIIFFGHWMDVYIMVMAGSMGEHAKIGFLEIGMLLAVFGFFIRVILTNLTKAPLMVKNHPYLDESLHHHI